MNDTMRLVIKFVGSTLVLDVIGIAGLAAFKITVPDIMEIIAGSSITYLAGLLTNPSKNNEKEEGVTTP